MSFEIVRNFLDKQLKEELATPIWEEKYGKTADANDKPILYSEILYAVQHWLEAHEEEVDRAEAALEERTESKKRTGRWSNSEQDRRKRLSRERDELVVAQRITKAFESFMNALANDYPDANVPDIDRWGDLGKGYKIMNGVYAILKAEKLSDAFLGAFDKIKSDYNKLILPRLYGSILSDFAHKEVSSHDTKALKGFMGGEYEVPPNPIYLDVCKLTREILAKKRGKLDNEEAELLKAKDPHSLGNDKKHEAIAKQQADITNFNGFCGDMEKSTLGERPELSNIRNGAASLQEATKLLPDKLSPLKLLLYAISEDYIRSIVPILPPPPGKSRGKHN